MTQYTQIRIKKSSLENIKNLIIPHFKKTHKISENNKISLPFILDEIIEYVLKEEKITR